MAYFEDLSVYSYRDEPDVVSPADRVDRSSPPYLRVDATMARVNIGWLGGRGRFGRRARYATGPVADGAVDALLDVIEAQAVNVTRGFHACEYCRGGDVGGHRLEHRGRTVVMGSSEIRVPAGGGVVFAAPTLIGHYVRDHGYCPPTAFIEALLAFRHGTTDLAQGWFTSLFGANPPPDLRAESPAP